MPRCRLIFFQDGSSPLFAYGLLRAVESREQPVHFDIDLDDDREDSPAAETERAGTGTELSEAPKKGHGLADTNLQPVVPSPGALDDISDVTTRSRRPSHPTKRRRAKSSTEDLRNSIEEEEQKLHLKEIHYGWHCQACLGEYDVIDAATLGSYAYLPIIRRS